MADLVECIPCSSCCFEILMLRGNQINRKIILNMFLSSLKLKYPFQFPSRLLDSSKHIQFQEFCALMSTGAQENKFSMHRFDSPDALLLNLFELHAFKLSFSLSDDRINFIEPLGATLIRINSSWLLLNC